MYELLGEYVSEAGVVEPKLMTYGMFDTEQEANAYAEEKGIKRFFVILVDDGA